MQIRSPFAGRWPPVSETVSRGRGVVALQDVSFPPSNLTQNAGQIGNRIQVMQGMVKADTTKRSSRTARPLRGRKVNAPTSVRSWKKQIEDVGLQKRRCNTKGPRREDRRASRGPECQKRKAHDESREEQTEQQCRSGPWRQVIASLRRKCQRGSASSWTLKTWTPSSMTTLRKEHREARELCL